MSGIPPTARTSPGRPPSSGPSSRSSHVLAHVRCCLIFFIGMASHSLLYKEWALSSALEPTPPSPPTLSPACSPSAPGTHDPTRRDGLQKALVAKTQQASSDPLEPLLQILTTAPYESLEG